MSVEQVVDTYLHMAQQLLGEPSATPGAPPPPPPPADLPHPEWLGNAATSAVTAGTALTQARQQLATAAKDLGTATTAAAQISRDAALQLKGITNDWDAAKASLASTPQPLRDSALITAGQQHIAEAMTLISATSARYSAAAATVHATATDLPASPKPPAAGQNSPSASPSGEDIGATATPSDSPESLNSLAVWPVLEGVWSSSWNSEEKSLASHSICSGALGGLPRFLALFSG